MGGLIKHQTMLVNENRLNLADVPANIWRPKWKSTSSVMVQMHHWLRATERLKPARMIHKKASLVLTFYCHSFQRCRSLKSKSMFNMEKGPSRSEPGSLFLSHTMDAKPSTHFVEQASPHHQSNLFIQR